MTEDERAGWQDHIGRSRGGCEYLISLSIASKADVRKLEHCLHMLKEAVMCQGDPTIITMKWASNSTRPIGNLTSPHECVNWDSLMEWVKPNSIDVFENGVLVHPELGKLFLQHFMGSASFKNKY